MFSGKKTVGIIGLGIIGSRIADYLKNSDYRVYVWNRTPKSVPNFLSSPSEVAEMARVIQIFVRDGEALLSVLEEMADKLTPKHIVMNHATIDLETTKKAAELVENREAQFLDAPFTGSRLAADAGKLIYYIGGDAKVLEKVRPILENSSKSIMHLGKIGDATVVKIASNMMSSASVQILSESMHIVQSAGVSLDKFHEAIADNACKAPVVDMKYQSIREEDFTPHFSLKNMLKDAELALDLAKQQNSELPALSATAESMRKGIEEGLGDEDFCILAKPLVQSDLRKDAEASLSEDA